MYVPLCRSDVVTPWAAPAAIQRDRLPVSNPPLVIALPPPPEEPIVQVKLADPDAPVVSLAVTVTLLVQAVVGAPEIRPEEELIERRADSPLTL